MVVVLPIRGKKASTSKYYEMRLLQSCFDRDNFLPPKSVAHRHLNYFHSSESQNTLTSSHDRRSLQFTGVKMIRWHNRGDPGRKSYPRIHAYSNA